MTGMGRNTIRTAQPQILRGRQAAKAAFCVADPGSIFPGSSACQVATGACQRRRTSSVGFVACGKWVALDSFSFSLDVLKRRRDGPLGRLQKQDVPSERLYIRRRDASVRRLRNRDVASERLYMTCSFATNTGFLRHDGSRGITRVRLGIS